MASLHQLLLAVEQGKLLSEVLLGTSLLDSSKQNAKEPLRLRKQGLIEDTKLLEAALRSLSSQALGVLIKSLYPARSCDVETSPIVNSIYYCSMPACHLLPAHTSTPGKKYRYFLAISLHKFGRDPTERHRMLLNSKRYVWDGTDTLISSWQAAPTKVSVL